MISLRIYRNNVLKRSETFKEDYEDFKKNTGHYVTNGFLVVLLGKENPLSKKIMKTENFVLSKVEKKLLTELLEKHILPQIKDFRSGDPLEDPCHKVVYKGKQYFANAKGVTYKKERDILRAMSLYNCFYDPEDKDIVEIKYHHSVD
jgi:hypothetical protein